MKTIIYKADANTAIGDSYPLPVRPGYDTNSVSFAADIDDAFDPAAALIPAVSGKTIYLTDLYISAAAAVQAWLEDSDGTQISPKFYLAANSTVPIKLNTALAVTASKGLYIQTSSAVHIGVLALGYQV